MKVTLKTRFMPKGEYEINMFKFQNGSPCMKIKSLDRPDYSLTATVALDRLPDDGCVWIKNYSENEGILEALIAAGVINQPCKTHKQGFVTFYQCELIN